MKALWTEIALLALSSRWGRGRGCMGGLAAVGARSGLREDSGNNCLTVMMRTDLWGSSLFCTGTCAAVF